MFFRSNNPIPRSGLPKFHEASSLRSLRDADVVPRIHLKARTIEQNVSWLAQAVAQVQTQINRMRRIGGQQDVAATFFPFMVMPSPPNPDPLADADEAWRTFRLRAGAVGLANVANTDGADANPDDPNLPDPAVDFLLIADDPDFGLDFVVPSGTLKFYVWIDCTDLASPFVDCGATPPGGSEDNFWRGSQVLVAIIDTQTNLAQKTATVRQYRRADIALASGCSETGSATEVPV